MADLLIDLPALIQGELSRRRVTQKQLAEELDVLPATINRLVKGHGMCDVPTFVRLCAWLGMAPGEFASEVVGKPLRDVVDGTWARVELPAFSGKPEACPKCEYSPTSERVAVDRFVREGCAEYLERQCRNCGFTWHEQCADARGSK